MGWKTTLPDRKGWYLCRDENGLRVRAFGNGLWWIDLGRGNGKDGWACRINRPSRSVWTLPRELRTAGKALTKLPNVRSVSWHGHAGGIRDLPKLQWLWRREGRTMSTLLYKRREYNQWVPIPESVAICPECGGKLYGAVHAWEARTGMPLSDEAEIGCENDEPGEAWHRQHRHLFDKWVLPLTTARLWVLLNVRVKTKREAGQ